MKIWSKRRVRGNGIHRDEETGQWQTCHCPAGKAMTKPISKSRHSRRSLAGIHSSLRNVGDRPPITTIGDRRIASMRVLTNGGESEEMDPRDKNGIPNDDLRE